MALESSSIAEKTRGSTRALGTTDQERAFAVHLVDETAAVVVEVAALNLHDRRSLPRHNTSTCHTVTPAHVTSNYCGCDKGQKLDTCTGSSL